ncbi:MAG: hypothetical protein QOI67_1360 [Gaiellaceae bacterium]|jgi:hypothetical protein|nr:hypothetical protein [Gaiellaceae bacterium]
MSENEGHEHRDFESPLTDSNRRPPPYHFGAEGFGRLRSVVQSRDDGLSGGLGLRVVSAAG